MAKITSYAELEKQINKACSKAVQNTCNKLLEVLQQYIMSEYYDVFNPKKYHRTMQFYDRDVIRDLRYYIYES